MSNPHTDKPNDNDYFMITKETIQPLIDMLNERMMDLAQNHSITQNDYEHAYQDVLYFMVVTIMRSRNHNDLDFTEVYFKDPKTFFENILMPTIQNVLGVLNKMWPNEDADIKYEIKDGEFRLEWGNATHMKNKFGSSPSDEGKENNK